MRASGWPAPSYKVQSSGATCNDPSGRGNEVGRQLEFSTILWITHSRVHACANFEVICGGGGWLLAWTIKMPGEPDRPSAAELLAHSATRALQISLNVEDILFNIGNLILAVNHLHLLIMGSGRNAATTTVKVILFIIE